MLSGSWLREHNSNKRAAQPIKTDVPSNTTDTLILEVAMAGKDYSAKLQKLQHHIQSLCGIYSRIARRLRVDRTYVSRVAKGERRSPEIEAALVQEFDRTQRKE